MYSLRFTQTFHDDVQSSVNYIRQTLQAPIAAQRLKDDIKNAYKSIKETPLMYPTVPNEYLASKGFRFKMVNSYVIFYIVDNKTIHIVRFLFGSRDWINILGDESLVPNNTGRQL
jgi:plasmid stabilization system protein ParE